MDLEKICTKKIAPRANKLDGNRRTLKRAYKMLGRKRLLAVQAPLERKGRGYSRADYFSFVELLQSYSGALGFLQRQHQSAGRILQASTRFQDWIPFMAKGKRRVGVAVASLRRHKQPTLSATRGENGYIVNGIVNWVSGYRIFDHLVVGFFFDDQEAMALVPFKRSPTLKLSMPIQTVALTSIQTVTLNFHNHLVADRDIITLNPKGTFNEMRSPIESHFVSFSALALACHRLLNGKGEELSEKYVQCREHFLVRENDDTLLELYGEMYRIARDFLELARFTIGAKSVICPNLLERLQREFLLFSVILTSLEVKEACLNQTGEQESCGVG